METINQKVSYETHSNKEVLKELETNIETGLSSNEAQDRLNKFGPNKLEEKKKKSWIRIFFEQMNNPMIFVLFGATIITIIVSIYDCNDFCSFWSNNHDNHCFHL